MDNRLELRAARLPNLKGYPDLNSKWESACAIGDEDLGWVVIFEMELRLVQAWPDLRHLFIALESREPSDIREDIIREAERRRGEMKRIRANVAKKVNPDGLTPRGNAYLSLASLSAEPSGYVHRIN